MSYYDTVYKHRLNKNGKDFQERIQTMRENNFIRFLNGSSSKIDFVYNQQCHSGVLQRDRQDSKIIIQELLTPIDCTLEMGSIIEFDIISGHGYWLVFWEESIAASGYNKYYIIKTTHQLNWVNKDKKAYSSWVYFSKRSEILQDKLQSDVPMYTEDDNLGYIALPIDLPVDKDIHINILINNKEEEYRVVGKNLISTKGVQYITVDPVRITDKTPKPEPTSNGDFWLGGDYNG